MTLPPSAQTLASDPLLTEAEVASYLRCSSSAMKMKRRRGQGPAAIKEGKFVRYRLSAVNAWLAGHSTAAAVA